MKSLSPGASELTVSSFTLTSSLQHVQSITDIPWSVGDETGKNVVTCGTAVKIAMQIINAPEKGIIPRNIVSRGMFSTIPIIRCPYIIA